MITIFFIYHRRLFTMKKTVFAALTLVCVLLAGCSEQGVNPQPGNADGTSTQSTSDESPVQSSDGESTEQTSADESIATSAGEHAAEKRSGYENHEVAFPAHEFLKNENNAKIFDVTPFKLKISLPDDWKISVPQNEDECGDGGFSPVYIMQNGEKIGSIDYDIYPSGKYDDNPNGEIDETQSDAYRQIYNQLMLGSVVNWDRDYKEVSTMDNAIVSTCRIMVKDTSEDEYAHGILARSKSLGVYVKINIDDASIPSDTVDYIAKTIVLK